ncbi:segregation/condensation protein A [Treponema sp.]
MEKRRYAVGQFEGPLDLLLALIKDNRIDLYDIPIAVVTEQFLEYLDEASSVDIGDLSDFYRMAARLVHLKSRMMIPAEPDEGDPFEFEDPRGDLVEMLIEYQRFKKLSSLM